MFAKQNQINYCKIANKNQPLVEITTNYSKHYHFYYFLSTLLNPCCYFQENYSLASKIIFKKLVLTRKCSLRSSYFLRSRLGIPDIFLFLTSNRLLLIFNFSTVSHRITAIAFWLLFIF